MNKIQKHLLQTFIFIGVFTLISTTTKAEDLTSPNYKIEGATLSGGDLATSTNFSLTSTISEITGNPYQDSSLYTAKLGSLETFIANTPRVKCFETDTDGSSDCESGPTYLNTNGIVTVCGFPGCYNKARFEIDEQDNPTDTLYGIQISEDNFVADVRQLDGTLGTLKEVGLRDISDYKTKASWESSTINIEGLPTNTQLWIRISALHGNFTESTFSPIVSATTVYPSVDFDIDIDDASGVATESSPPYTISFQGDTTLFRGGSLQTADDLIWLDLSTNANRGAVILEVGENGGLDSSSSPYLISSATDNLSIVPEGFGLQNFDHTGTDSYCNYMSGGGSGELGNILVETDYSAPTDHSVGIVSTSYSKVYDGDSPLASCRVAMKAKAKASTSAIAASDYTETITIIAVPRY
jgi:hypothetical protein